MPYSIKTKDGITINNIPDDVAPDSEDLKKRVADIRSSTNVTQEQSAHSVNVRGTFSKDTGKNLSQEITGKENKPLVSDKEDLGILGTLKDTFTGESKMTPEMENLGSIGYMPELNKMSMEGLKSAFVSMTGDPGETAKALKVNFPDIEVRQDSKGNLIVKSAIDGKEYKVNEPGLDARDLVRGAITAAMFSPIGGIEGGALKKIGAGAITQSAIESAQQGMGGTFDVEQPLIAGAAEGIAPAIASSIKGGRGIFGKPTALADAAKSGIEDLEKTGITPMTSDVFQPDTYAGKMGQSMGEKIPIFGTGGLRVSQQEERTNAVRDVIRQFGGDQAAQVSDAVMADLQSTRTGFIKKYTTMKNDIFNRLSSKGKVNVSNTDAEIKNEISALEKLKTKGVEPIISIFKDYRKAIKNQDIQNIETLRKQLGDQLKDPSLAGVRSIGEKSLSKIYGALRTDIGDFVKEFGEKTDYTKWRVANARLKEGIKELDVNVLKTALDKGEATPEMVRGLLFSSKPSDVRLLNKNLSAKGRSYAKAAIMQEVLSKSGGMELLSPEKFMTTMKSKGIEIPSNIFFSKQDKDVMVGLMKALQMTKRASQANVKASTGEQMTTFAAPAALTSYFGLAGGLGATAGLGSLARLYESKPVRDALLRVKYADKGKEEEALKHLGMILQSARQASEGEEEQ